MSSNILQIFTEMVLIVCCVSRVHRKKINLSIRKFLLIFFNVIFVETVYVLGLPTYLAFFAYIAIWIYAVLEYKISLKKEIVYLAFAIVWVCLLQVIIYAVIYLMFFNLEDAIIRGTIVNCLATMFVCFFGKRIQINQIIQFIELKVDKLKIVIIMLFVAIGCLLYTFKNTNFMDNSVMIAMVIFLSAICIAINQWGRVSNEAENERLKNEMHESYNDAFEELIKGVRDRQHEFSNHINAIYGLHATAQTLEELVEKQNGYGEQITVMNRYNKLLRNAESPVFIGFLYMKFSSADEKGIMVRYNVAVGKLTSAVPIYEMVEIIGILLDNAIEAVLDNETQNKDLHVKIFEDDKEIHIEIANPCQYMKSSEIEQFFISGYSTKGEQRGLGLAKLKGIIGKYRIACLVENKEEKGRNLIHFELSVLK